MAMASILKELLVPRETQGGKGTQYGKKMWRLRKVHWNLEEGACLVISNEVFPEEVDVNRWMDN